VFTKITSQYLSVYLHDNPLLCRVNSPSPGYLGLGSDQSFLPTCPSEVRPC
jgi:hypothetical protein